MKQLAVVTVAWVLITGAGCVTTRDPSGARSQILRLDQEWSQAAQSRDVERVLSYWADDATVLPPGSPAVQGKAAIREFVEKSFETPGFQISWVTIDVIPSIGGDFAYGLGKNRMSFTGADGKPVVVEGKAVTIWRREPSGAWKCVVDMWNDAAPPSK